MGQKSGKKTMTSQFTDMTSLSSFLICRVFLAKFSYWSMFHVNIMTGSGFMTIFVYKRLTRNPEIGITSDWVLPNISRLGWVRVTKCGRNVSNKKLLNDTKCQIGVKFVVFSFSVNSTSQDVTIISVKKTPSFSWRLARLVKLINLHVWSILLQGVQYNPTCLKAVSLVSNKLSYRDNAGGQFTGSRASKRKGSSLQETFQ